MNSVERIKRNLHTVRTNPMNGDHISEYELDISFLFEYIEELKKSLVDRNTALHGKHNEALDALIFYSKLSCDVDGKLWYETNNIRLLGYHNVNQRALETLRKVR